MYNDDYNDENDEGMMGAAMEGAGAVAVPVAEATPAPPAPMVEHGYRHGIGFQHTVAHCVPVPQCHGYLWVN